MQQRHDVVLLFKHRTDCQVTDPKDRERVIRERNGVRTRVRQTPGRLEIAVQIQRLWRVQFCDDDGMAARDQVEQTRFDRAFLWNGFGFRQPFDYRFGSDRLQPGQRPRHFPDMLRTDAAATAN